MALKQTEKETLIFFWIKIIIFKKERGKKERKDRQTGTWR
jgi:hypothetical protein